MQKTKDYEEIEKIEKYSQKNIRIVYCSLCMHLCVWGGIFAYYCVYTYKWYLVCVCMKIHAQCDKFEVVYWQTHWEAHTSLQRI